MVVNQKVNDLIKPLDDIGMLEYLKLIEADATTGKRKLTLAGLLLFGKDKYIHQHFPNYKTDAIVSVYNHLRYDDREVVTTNLIDSYEMLIKFGERHLKDLFTLDGDKRISSRDVILREIIANTLMHRDYSHDASARFIIEGERLFVDNENVSEGKVIASAEKIKPQTKNPLIAETFRALALADSFGSGLKNAYKYSMLYSNKPPIVEDDGRVFTTIIPLKKIVTLKLGGDDNTKVKANKDELISFIKEVIRGNDRITKSELVELTGVSESTIKRVLREIKNLKHEGGRNGRWVLTEDE